MVIVIKQNLHNFKTFRFFLVLTVKVCIRENGNSFIYKKHIVKVEDVLIITYFKNLLLSNFVLELILIKILVTVLVLMQEPIYN